jgi:hypothetical protein
VNGEHCFVVGQPKKVKDDVYIAKDMIEIGDGKTIPLWLLGFLY